VIALALVSTARAQQWPTWRGPSASGISTEEGLPVEWSETQAIAWKAPVRGLGISSPIVWRNLVFVTSQVGSGDVRPGPRLAQGAEASAAGERALGAGPEGGDGKVVFLVTALDRASGERAWEYELPAEGPLPAKLFENASLAVSAEHCPEGLWLGAEAWPGLMDLLQVLVGTELPRTPPGT
jgi:hypothetical protein